jgi:hypothetical protein
MLPPRFEVGAWRPRPKAASRLSEHRGQLLSLVLLLIEQALATRLLPT